MKNISLVSLVFAVSLAACGEVPGAGSEPSALVATPCTDVAAAQNCVYSPGHNGPSPTVTCQTNHAGTVVPVVGCMISLLADPQTPYEALCVASCD